MHLKINKVEINVVLFLSSCKTVTSNELFWIISYIYIFIYIEERQFQVLQQHIVLNCEKIADSEQFR